MKATSVAARAKKIPGQYTTVHQIHTTHSDATPSWSHAGCAVDAKRRGEMREFGRQCGQTGVVATRAQFISWPLVAGALPLS